MKTRSRAIVIALILALYATTFVAFYATALTTVTLFPIKDSYSWESVPDANNGKSDNFEITSYAGHNMRGWIEFNTTSIPTDAWIMSAQLRLRLWQKTTNNPPYGDSTGRVYGVYMITEPWGEMNVSWAHQPSYTDFHHSTSIVPTEQGGWYAPIVWMTWDITDAVIDWQQGTPNYGLVVRDTQENSTLLLYSTQFFTHDQVPNENYFPRLIVTYVNPLEVYALAFLIIVESIILALWIRKHEDSSANLSPPRSDTESKG